MIPVALKLTDSDLDTAPHRSAFERQQHLLADNIPFRFRAVPLLVPLPISIPPLPLPVSVDAILTGTVTAFRRWEKTHRTKTASMFAS